MLRSHHEIQMTLVWSCPLLPVKSPYGWGYLALQAAWLVLVAFPILATYGQDIAGIELFPDEPSMEQEGSPYLDDSVQRVMQCDNSPCSCEFCDSGPQWVNWISGPYIRSGVSFVLGDGLLSKNQGVGYTIQGGVRQPFGPGIGSGRTFLDMGGSYLSAMGELTRPTTGVVVRRDPLGNNPSTEPHTFQTTLTEVQRGSAHVALGWCLGLIRDDPHKDPQPRLAIRVGGRLSHVRGRFQTVADPIDPPLGNTDSAEVIFSKTNTAGGLFLSTEMILLNRDTAFGNLAWTVDGEFAHDWIDFEGFEDRGLATAAVQVGLTLTR